MENEKHVYYFPFLKVLFIYLIYTQRERYRDRIFFHCFILQMTAWARAGPFWIQESRPYSRSPRWLDRKRSGCDMNNCPKGMLMSHVGITVCFKVLAQEFMTVTLLRSMDQHIEWFKSTHILYPSFLECSVTYGLIWFFKIRII